MPIVPVLVITLLGLVLALVLGELICRRTKGTVHFVTDEESGEPLERKNLSVRHIFRNHQ